MSVNVPAAANRIFQEFDTTLLQQWKDAPRVFPAYGMEVPSSSRSTLHAWLIQQASVREWKGSRILNEMGAVTWEVVNRNWELSWKFNEYQIQDDLSGLVQMALMNARDSGALWAQHEDTLCAATLQGGGSALCYDGQYYFDTDHPQDPTGVVSGTYSNLNTSAALTFANYNAALVQLKSFKLPNGAPWVMPNSEITLMVDSTKLLAANQIVNVDTMTTAAAYGLAGTSGASTNPFFKTAKVVENQYLNSEAGVWYLSVKRGSVGGIMFQRRQGVETQEIGPGSQLYFDKKEYQIGQDARYSASYTYPQLMIRNEP